MKKIIYILFFTLIICFESYSQTIRNHRSIEPTIRTRILFIFDASFSMHSYWQSDTKITIANRIMNEMLDSLANIGNLELALRVFGHQKNFPPQDCDDSKLEVPFGANNALKIKQRLRAINPRGTTPIALSLELAANDFPPCDKCRNIIVLITDGKEECGGDPCAVSLELQKKGITLRPFIIGIGSGIETNLECIGTFFNGNTENEFRIALNYIISQILNTTTCQVNLLDINGHITETNVNMSFYDATSNRVLYNFIHTMNTEGNPDTLFIDPIPSYYVKIHTIPPVYTDTFSLLPGKHKIIAARTPQGSLEFVTQRTHFSLPRYNFIVRKHKSNEILNVQMLNSSEKYLVGEYDLEVLTLPRILIEGVKVDQSKTTIVEIPLPGTLLIEYFTPGFGSLYVLRNNKMEWIHNLSGVGKSESIMLLPGEYVVVFRARHHNKSVQTIERKFNIISNQTTVVRLSQ